MKANEEGARRAPIYCRCRRPSNGRARPAAGLRLGLHASQASHPEKGAKAPAAFSSHSLRGQCGPPKQNGPQRTAGRLLETGGESGIASGHASLRCAILELAREARSRVRTQGLRQGSHPTLSEAMRSAKNKAARSVLRAVLTRVAERVGFEPTVGVKPTFDFESSALNRAQPSLLLRLGAGN